jgi:fatty acid desaturase
MLKRIEWPTLALLLVTYVIWGGAVFWLPALSLPLAVIVAGLAIAQHSSLQHEAMHGHPFSDPRWNAALVFPALTLAIPYFRFRDTHLDHHRNSALTDPFDDPESNYLDEGTWAGLPAAMRWLLALNNTLAGRILLGPLIGTAAFIASDIRNAPSDPRVRAGWLWHLPMVLPVLVIVLASPMPLWAYGLAAYLGLGLLRIRTFLEHQAHDQERARSVIIEDRGPLALLFLNNNLHVVHHMHPRVPWYRLPALYRSNAERYLRMNEGYVYRSYGEVFRRYLFRRKDPVAHPLWRRQT